MRHATVEGRLTTDELEERLEALSSARTYGALDALVADLPVSRSHNPPRVRVSRWVAAAGVATLAFTVLSMLAAAGHHFAERFGDHPGPFGQVHHLMAAAAAMAAVFAGVLLCAAVVICVTLLWRLQRSRRARPKS